eukprot:TRINITY_DN4014_c0_g1_i1.p1 TRINITY_DN4014_c0_g1~~TRINITY_DN4014_c0_g1_i1.p1  ORF type:complete len:301 (+),score=100.44 TRINITY_DN4014_c0_g1_i1:129-905(+)
MAGMLRPTAVCHRGRHAGLLRPSPVPHGIHDQNNFIHNFIGYMKFHDKNLDVVAAPGTPNPRDKYIWRRLSTRILGNWRVFFRDNIYKEEIPIVFTEPIPGGHGDRFTHSFQPRYLVPNGKAFWAKVQWERDNLTPEQLAAKYGIYMPRAQKGSIVMSNLFWSFFWVFLLLGYYRDDDTVVLTHPCLDDFVREMGGIEPIHEDDLYLEQWVHPWFHRFNARRLDAHWMYKPLMKDDVVEQASPLGAMLGGSYTVGRSI